MIRTDNLYSFNAEQTKRKDTLKSIRCYKVDFADEGKTLEYLEAYLDVCKRMSRIS